MCNVISLICLILTFMTYVLFKSLRTVPGQNNMTLVLFTSNILVSFIDNDYQSIGYGGDLCFIVFKLAAIITFLCPVGIILLSNVIMFAAAVFNICSSPHVSSENVSHEKKNNIVIYFKLFAITGCTWLLQFIDALFPISMFTVLISMCNLLTGIFIFMSYICNERVLELYKSKFIGGNKYLFSGISPKSATNQTTLHS
ncbi:adhesion G protein-coupled receptor E3-like [Mytilus californianus]|uniref:adhesion G protein-coupled receptor E3-like n=1 Tax=Mytilus californianus TaxID=6549 RepID=UPI002247CBA4|nr:adhesion G protein-coupled receptor E3-like [Mytilus californianus]